MPPALESASNQKINGEAPNFAGEAPSFDGEAPKSDGEAPTFDCEAPNFSVEGPKVDGEGLSLGWVDSAKVSGVGWVRQACCAGKRSGTGKVWSERAL